MSNWYKYSVYLEPEGEPVFEGLMSELCKFLDVKGDYVRDRLKGGHDTVNGYYIKREIAYERKVLHADDTWTNIVKPVAKKRSGFARRLKEIEMLLDRYGNTSASKDPKKFIPALEKDGYFVSVRYTPKKKVRYKGGAGVAEIWPEIWILKLERKEEKPDEGE